MARVFIRLVIYSLPLPVLVLSLCLGPTEIISPRRVLLWLPGYILHPGDGGAGLPGLLPVILGDVRLPRVLLTFLVGGALSMSGNALQALFRNPLVSPYVLGVSSGSAFGATLAIIFPLIPIQASAFFFGLFAAAASFFIARGRTGVEVTSLILSGVIISGVFTSLLALIQFLVDPNRLQAIVQWTMGNLHTASWTKVASSCPLILGSAVCLWLLGWRMNVLALGDEEARAVGIDPEREKVWVLVPAVLAASASVAAAGIIGFMGLVVPHLIRMMLGPDNRHAVPACFAFGGVFLLMVDNISRTLAPFEIPVGIFTTFLGSPLFVYLLRKTRSGWDL